ncbi:MAG: hypothetical protein ABL881_01550 [Novosphingobium sp.]
MQAGRASGAENITIRPDEHGIGMRALKPGRQRLGEGFQTILGQVFPGKKVWPDANQTVEACAILRNILREIASGGRAAGKEEAPLVSAHIRG